MTAVSHCDESVLSISQIDRMEQFFVAEGLPHLMFYYQNTEPNEAGRLKMDTHCVTN